MGEVNLMHTVSYDLWVDAKLGNVDLMQIIKLRTVAKKRPKNKY